MPNGITNKSLKANQTSERTLKVHSNVIACIFTIRTVSLTRIPAFAQFIIDLNFYIGTWKLFGNLLCDDYYGFFLWPELFWSNALHFWSRCALVVNASSFFFFKEKNLDFITVESFFFRPWFELFWNLMRFKLCKP